MWFDIVYGPHNSRNVLIESLLFLVVSQQLENDIVTSVLSVIISVKSAWGLFGFEQSSALADEKLLQSL